MPAKSKAQQQAAGIAHAAKKGEIPKKELRGPSSQMFKNMNDLKIKKFAHTKRKGLPQRVKEGMTARQMFEREHLTEGRDDALDASKVNLGATGRKFARMTSKEAFKTTDGTDDKWKTSAALRSELAGEKPGAQMKNKDAVGPVGHAFKEATKPRQIVNRLLDEE